MARRARRKFTREYKAEVVRPCWPTRAAARSAVFTYIETFCNRERRHSTLGNLSPEAYEAACAAA
ncbi:MAG: IS3 family transposase [Candidatus Dormibacteria bacterium]